MGSVKDRIDKLKQVHYIVSLLLFVATLFFCTYTADDLKLINISLSHFGIRSKIGALLNASLFIVLITLFIDTYRNISKFGLGRLLLYLFAVSIVCLLLTASINMTYKIHFFTAYVYFIGYTLGMFLFGYSLIKVDFRIGVTSIVIA